ncbi:cytochrome c [Gluconacetobacter johannae DSM 13595]|nr:cytochrome c [Gluconacetobacter johannae]GBQ91434.1 cytochrome c [Gluconacetobacter johannae DSM 13595]
MTRLLAACLLLAASAAPAMARPAAARPSYTAEQADRGAALYQGACAMCHGASLGGAFDVPPLTGRFVMNWAGAPLSDLFGYIRRAMPQMAPGTLSADDTASLVAFLLRQNGTAPGGTLLAARPQALTRVVFPFAGSGAH